MTVRMRFGAECQEQAPGQETREFPRVVVWEQAVVRVAGSNVAIPCIIENISAGGAKLDFGEPLVMPSRFELEVGPRYRVVCELVWMAGTKAGVRFCG